MVLPGRGLLEAGRRVNQPNQYTFHDPDRLPCEVVAPVLEYAFSQWVVYKNARAGASLQQTGGHHIACHLLERDYGWTADTWAKRLNNILALRTATCSLNIVDHFLVILGQHHLWYCEPLSDYYFSEQVLSAA